MLYITQFNVTLIVVCSTDYCHIVRNHVCHTCSEGGRHENADWMDKCYLYDILVFYSYICAIGSSPNYERIVGKTIVNQTDRGHISAYQKKVNRIQGVNMPRLFSLTMYMWVTN